MVTQDNTLEFNELEGQAIVNKHKSKLFQTLQTLLSLTNMMYYWEKIKSLFENQEPNVEHVAKLITRCLKLYMLIDGLMTVFNLIQKTEVSLNFLFYHF